MPPKLPRRNTGNSSASSTPLSPEEARDLVTYAKDSVEPAFYVKRTAKRAKQSELEWINALASNPRWDRLPESVQWTLIGAHGSGHSVDELVRTFDRSLVNAGEAVGVIAAQSISEQTQQATLNSFHKAGAIKSAAVGLVRLNEIMDAARTQKIPALCGLKCRHPERLIERRLVDVCGDSGVMYLPGKKIKRRSLCPYVIFFDHAGSAGSIDHLPVTIQRDAWRDGDRLYIGSSPVTVTLGAVKSRYRTIGEYVASGLPGAVSYIADEHALLFSGGNKKLGDDNTKCNISATLGEVVHALGEYDVDMRGVYPTDVYYIEATLGIEAARMYIASEITRVLEGEGIHVNRKHIGLIADNMTNSGRVLGNTYRGVEMHESVLAKATIQEATNTLQSAASKGLSDDLTDVSSCILMGVRPSIGTMMSEMLDMKLPVVERGFGDNSSDEPEYYMETSAVPTDDGSDYGYFPVDDPVSPTEQIVSANFDL